MKKVKKSKIFILTLFLQILTGKVVLIDSTIKKTSIRERISKEYWKQMGLEPKWWFFENHEKSVRFSWFSKNHNFGSKFLCFQYLFCSLSWSIFPPPNFLVANIEISRIKAPALINTSFYHLRRLKSPENELNWK